MRYQIEAGYPAQIVCEADSWPLAVAMAKFESAKRNSSPTAIIDSAYPGTSTTVYYGADTGETVEAAEALVASAR